MSPPVRCERRVGAKVISSVLAGLALRLLVCSQAETTLYPSSAAMVAACLVAETAKMAPSST